MQRLQSLYEGLLARHGRQGWWPLQQRAGRPGFDARGYHPGRFSVAPEDRFEVCVGAILTQNTAWRSVERAIANLLEAGLLNARAMRSASRERLAALIRPAGYYNQKARKLQEFAARFDDGRVPSRDELLSLWGIGPETADSMLLYAWNVPVFVIDAYTRRVLARSGLPSPDTYAALQALFMESLPRDFTLYNEFHALLVAEAKRLKKPSRSA